jgi:hypothetical protein
MSRTCRALRGLGLWLACVTAVAAAQGVRPSATACPMASELKAADLYGLWRLSLWAEGGNEQAPGSTGAVLLGPHAEFPDSVRGRLRRSGPGADLEAEVAGDVGDDGEFNLDESADGQTMDAVWSGQPTDCGRTIRGLRRPAEGRPHGGPRLHFLLQRTSPAR